MMTNDLLVGSYRMASKLLHRFTDDLTPEEFWHQPVPGANSAAWIVGHLALTLRRTAERLGAAELPPLPTDFVERFAQTGKPASAQSQLGNPRELLNLFDLCLAKVSEAAKAISSEALAGPSTSPGPFASNFAEGILFGSMHIAMHVGQLSTIRRSLGKPPAA